MASNADSSIETNVGGLEQCQEHKKEKLTRFCEDHCELICHACHAQNHQKCRTTQHLTITRDLMRSLQVSDPESDSSHPPVQGYQPGAESKPDPIIKVKSSKKYSVNIAGDKYKCAINGICETASGELVITDSTNVKLLDQTYKVVDHCNLPYDPTSMCSISSSLVAVAVANSQFHHNIHFFGVKNGRLTKERILKLENCCELIAYQHGNLYVSGGRALYHYTLKKLKLLKFKGRLFKKMYEVRAGRGIITSCAVSPDGDRIYVANASRNELVTLSRDGTVISYMTHPELVHCGGLLTGLHVTDSGQVLVCGAHSILQVFIDGRQRAAEVVTTNDGVNNPISVYYSKHTASLIVGMFGNNDMIVFEAQ